MGMTSGTEAGGAMRIGEVFVRWKNKFVAYSTYCANLPASRALIERYENENQLIKQKIAVRSSCLILCSINYSSFFQECGYEANRNQFRLQDLLSVPMQRVLKYHILLNVCFLY